MKKLKKLLFLANETSWEIRDAQTQRTLASSKFDRDLLLHGLRELGKSLGFTVNAGILEKGKIMRCPNCNKFVSMENGEPEVNGVNCAYSNGGFDVTCEVHHTRNCADCGTELKAVDGDAEGRVELVELEGWDKLTPEAQLEIKTKLEAGEIEPETEDTGSEADENLNHLHSQLPADFGRWADPRG